MPAAATFSQFLTVAKENHLLVRDLCAESDLISRSRLLQYFENNRIPPADKEGLIDKLVHLNILVVEQDNEYSVNGVVADLVNYYERRGRLTSAAFLRDQIVAMADLTDELQIQLTAADINQIAIADTADTLYRLVREVRESGHSHYIACMHLFGEMKRNNDQKSIKERLEALETVQRRHIEPLNNLLDPSGEYAPKIVTLKRRVREMGENRLLLAQSQELQSAYRRLQVDLHYIDYALLQQFTIAADTARALLNSLLEEKSIKDAIATSLGRLNEVWALLPDTPILVTGRRFNQAPPVDELGQFFLAVWHGQWLPHPTPMTAPPVTQQVGDDIFIGVDKIRAAILTHRHIPSWPRYVVESFATYPADEQLRALTYPLLQPIPQLEVSAALTPFEHDFAQFRLKLQHDFGLHLSEKEPHHA